MASFQSMEQLLDNMPCLARLLYLCCRLITIANCSEALEKQKTLGNRLLTNFFQSIQQSTHVPLLWKEKHGENKYWKYLFWILSLPFLNYEACRKLEQWLNLPNTAVRNGCQLLKQCCVWVSKRKMTGITFCKMLENNTTESILRYAQV